MGQYLDRIDAAAPAERWPLVRRLMTDAPQPFLHELQHERPVLALPGLTFVTRYLDCSLILHRFRDFTVDLYKPKQGAYFMAQDDTADHWRDKGVMRAVLDLEDLPKMRAFVARRAASILARAGGAIDLPQALTRAVPVALVREFFGFAGARASTLTEWSYWSQQDAFHNQSFDADVTADQANTVAKRQAASAAMATWLGKLAVKRGAALRAGGEARDPVSRLLRLSASGGVTFPPPRVMLNVGGLLVGSVETTSHSANKAIAELFSRPDVLVEAREAAAAKNPRAFDGFVFEALRFRPPFPYYFRVCRTATTLAGDTPHATTVQPGTVILACTQAAMLDPAAYADPLSFDARRTAWQTFLFGYGEHECLGRAAAAVMLPEIVRQCLRLPNARLDGGIDFRNGVPERLMLRWDA